MLEPYIPFQFKISFNYELPMEEPDERELQTVVQEITRSLLRGGLGIIFYTTQEGIQPTMTALDSVQLPPKINKYLGFAENFVISTSSVISRNSNNPVQEEEPKFESSSQVAVSETLLAIPVNLNPTQMLVTCSAVQDQYYGDKLYKLLRVCDIGQDYINPSRKTFSPILYLPLASHDVSQIRIVLLDEFGRRLNFGSNPVQLTLHFRAIDQ